MLTKPEFDALAAGDYSTYRTAARRRALRTALATTTAILIVGSSILYRAYPAYRDYILLAARDLRSTMDSRLWEPATPYRDAANR